MKIWQFFYRLHRSIRDALMLWIISYYLHSICFCNRLLSVCCDLFLLLFCFVLFKKIIFSLGFSILVNCCYDVFCLTFFILYQKTVCRHCFKEDFYLEQSKSWNTIIMSTNSMTVRKPGKLNQKCSRYNTNRWMDHWNVEHTIVYQPAISDQIHHVKTTPTTFNWMDYIQQPSDKSLC